jgi:hypothetical protein
MVAPTGLLKRSGCVPTDSSRSDSSMMPTSWPLDSTGSCATSAARMRLKAIISVSSGRTLMTSPASKRRPIRSRRSCCAALQQPWSRIQPSL